MQISPQFWSCVLHYRKLIHKNYPRAGWKWLWGEEKDL